MDFRGALMVALFAVSLSPLVAADQNADSLQSYFVGKEVAMKIDMPGSQKGVDSRFNKQTPMDWKEYWSRIKEFGVAIHKGDTAPIEPWL